MGRTSAHLFPASMMSHRLKEQLRCQPRDSFAVPYSFPVETSRFASLKREMAGSSGSLPANRCTEAAQ
jgi:hypothetical protein